MVCGDCERLFNALMQTLEDERRRLKNRLKYIDEPPLPKEEAKAYAEKRLADIEGRIQRLKEVYDYEHKR